MYPNGKGAKHTVISFEPLFLRPDICGLTDAKIGKKLGLETQSVKAMRYNREVPFDTLRVICHALGCQPGEIIEAITAECFPAKSE